MIRAMELEEGIYVELMKKLISGMALEDQSLEWLMKKRERMITSIVNGERSAREIREYVIDEYDGRDGASPEVKERKDKLVEAIELSAKLNMVFVKRLDEEIAKRVDK